MIIMTFILKFWKENLKRRILLDRLYTIKARKVFQRSTKEDTNDFNALSKGSQLEY